MRGSQLSAMKQTSGPTMLCLDVPQALSNSQLDEHNLWRKRNYPNKLSAIGLTEESQMASPLKERNIRGRNDLELEEVIAEEVDIKKQPIEIDTRLTQVYGSVNMNSLANMNMALRGKNQRSPLSGVDKNIAKKYINNRIYTDND